MSRKIIPFPRGEKRRRNLALSKYRVPCQVSDRWLQFPKTANAFDNGDFLRVDVMTMGENEKERKICELILTKQDLMHMIQQVATSV